ncbi:hemerythrin domain-containing protein [candidate division FCPU426 bacterium]|nr:hemerythrin domain-containing protein [candidate division FCPU426 bacterium]
MQPIGLLMIEHRLIERMVKLMRSEAVRIEQDKEPDMAFVRTAVDFIRFYADRCHHGKEEDILFKALELKPLSKEHKRIMTELIQEHAWGRETLARLEQAGKDFASGNQDALDELRATMKELAEFYPQHIIKEDKHFFIPIMQYFNQAEQDAMLAEEYGFDRKMIHEKYRAVVEDSERVTTKREGNS